MRRRDALALLLGGAACSAVSGVARPLRARPVPPPPKPLPALPLAVAVALGELGPVRDEAWVDAQIAEANRLLELPVVAVTKVAARSLERRFARLESREDRDALATALGGAHIHVMVVESLKDVDEADRYRMGVHWRLRKDTSKRWVILAQTAAPSVLAHELGHYFGLGHSKVPDNVMSYDRTGGAIAFDAAQARVIRAAAERLLSSKTLVP